MRWMEQGIWREEWNAQNGFFGKWKHEEPLPEEKSDMNSENMPVIGLFWNCGGGETTSQQPQSRPARAATLA